MGDAPLNVLVNNAAYETYVQLAEAEMELVEDILRVNLVLPAMLAKALIPNLQKGEDPSVINVTSIHDTVAVANNGPYAMAKAGLLMYTRNAAIEFAKLGIRVNALAPGAIETDMNRETINKLGREKFNAWIPAGRWVPVMSWWPRLSFWRVVGLAMRPAQGFASMELTSIIRSVMEQSTKHYWALLKSAVSHK